MLLHRREFLKLAAALPAACVSVPAGGVEVNDVHSQLNATRVANVVTPRSLEELQTLIRSTRGSLAIAGGRHAMGGQQFASGATLIDIRQMTRVHGVADGVIEVESGIQWPELIAATRETKWGIAQKQTGADRLTLGGSLAANVHGRGLTMKPIVGDVESFTLNGIECSRTKNGELFRLAIGGYGLFGVVETVRLRLMPRRKVQRVVEEQTIETLMAAFERRIAEGFLYGDFQFSIDEASENFLRKGVFSCYRPVSDDTPTAVQMELRPEDWMGLLMLAHVDKEQAYRRYVEYYLATSGQVYWSDEHQLSFYPDDYHRAIGTTRATEMITEIYVPRARLADFMHEAAAELRRRNAGVVYGTVRLIERDDETFLAWAKQPYACVIFNLHVEHADVERSAEAFRALIDLAIARNGSYYLTYHRWARRDQVEACYPRFEAFLAEKKRFDTRFTSEWYRHYERMFG
jgi:FAD/FMN-containing dehydrogenase